MQDVTQRCIDAYARHKHLKLAAQEVGIPWQSVYVHLRRAGVPVTGDKARYGSATDRLAVMAERQFLELVPFAQDMNRRKFQSKVDFIVRGHSVDVKASRYREKHQRWAFSLKKQECVADFFVCFTYPVFGSEPQHVLLIPGEIARHYGTMSVSARTRSKWWDYEVDLGDLREFFEALPGKVAEDAA